jgi:thiol peroxidase
MATITFQGNPVETAGTLPDVNSTVPDFNLTKTDLSDVSLADFRGKRLILNIFPSIDTPVCASSVRRFNEEASKLEDTAVLCISADLPFAQDRFCGAEGLNNVVPLSVFRSAGFGKDYGVAITRKVIYTEQVPEVTNEPDYATALEALQ